MSAWLKTHGWRVGLAALVLGFGVWISDRTGVPKSLPAAALDWRLLFHLERAAAVLAAIGVVLLVGWRALKGEFPFKFGQFEYAVKDTAAKSEAVAARLEKRIEFLEALNNVGPPPPDDVE